MTKTSQTIARTDTKALHMSARWMALTYLLTTVHHVYSSTFIEADGNIAGVFAGQWRAHGFLVFLVPVMVGIGGLLAYGHRGDRHFLYSYALVSGGVFTGIIGVWEGGWNHVAKLVVFALGLQDCYAYGPSWLLQFPAVQPPKDLFFEATGVLTLFFGLINAYYLWSLIADRKQVAPSMRMAA
jgi:hypothetical protein